MKSADYFNHPVFKASDVFIHQSIWKKNRYGEEYASENVISRLRPDCQIIAMPNVYHLPKCLFPQYYEAQELRYDNATYFFRDRIIDEGIQQGKSLKQIAEQYYEYHFDKMSIKEGYKNFLETLRKREQEWDVKVADFIDENIKEQMIFFEMNHPTNFLIKHYAINILNVLLCGKPYSVEELKNYKMDTYQMPLLTEVQKALGLKYSTIDQEIRTTGTKLRRIPMTIEEYVKEYFASVWICGDFEEAINKKVQRRILCDLGA